MALTNSLVRQFVNRGVRTRIWDHTFDSSYLTGGEVLTAATLGFNVVQDAFPQQQSGYTPFYDRSNGKLMLYWTPDPAGTSAVAGAGATIEVTDNDSAASAGLVVYFHTDEVSELGLHIGHLESITAGNADSFFALSSGGATIKVVDDDAANTAGKQIYFDEDGTAEGRFKIVADPAQDHYVRASDGSLLKLAYDADAATEGVALYFDDDAANDYERIQFISPTQWTRHLMPVPSRPPSRAAARP